MSNAEQISPSDSTIHVTLSQSVSTRLNATYAAPRPRKIDNISLANAECVGDGRAIDGHERPPPALRKLVRAPRQHLLAGAALADQRQGDVLRGDGAKDWVRLFHGVGAHDRLKHHVRSSFSLSHARKMSRDLVATCKPDDETGSGDPRRPSTGEIRRLFGLEIPRITPL
ncbi:hypothetical protein [Sorangium sp. So ce1000]|uniref:hypothetical protein n=1 Tax=Sorangium sp. So ce1000 TaxID=3133325 RepID=UPI003F5DFBE7